MKARLDADWRKVNDGKMRDIVANPVRHQKEGEPEMWTLDLETKSVYGTLSMEFVFPKGFPIREPPSIRVTSPVLHPMVDMTTGAIEIGRIGNPKFPEWKLGYFTDLILRDIAGVFRGTRHEYPIEKEGCTNGDAYDVVGIPDGNFIRLSNGECWDVNDLMEYISKFGYVNVDPRNPTKTWWGDAEQFARIIYHPGLEQSKRKAAIDEGIRTVASAHSPSELFSRSPETFRFMAELGWTVHTDTLGGAGGELSEGTSDMIMEFWTRLDRHYGKSEIQCLRGKLVVDLVHHWNGRDDATRIVPYTNYNLDHIMDRLGSANCPHEVGFYLLVLYIKYHHELFRDRAPLQQRVFQLRECPDVYLSYAWYRNRRLDFDHWYVIAVDVKGRSMMRFLSQGGNVGQSNHFLVTAENGHLLELVRDRYSDIVKSVRRIEEGRA